VTGFINRQPKGVMLNQIKSFFSQLRQKLFNQRIEREIYHRMFPHLLREKDFGYSFETDEQMNAQTEKLDVKSLLDTVERHIQQMPKSYGESFRHIMHRDLHVHMKAYEKLAHRRVQRTCDPRFVAESA
jgi:hypothetical protein